MTIAPFVFVRRRGLLTTDKLNHHPRLTMAYSNGNSNHQSDLLRVGGLWKNETKDGKTYLAGSLGSLRLLIFQNKFKEKESDPDYILSVAPSKPKEDQPKQRKQQEFI